MRPKFREETPKLGECRDKSPAPAHIEPNYKMASPNVGIAIFFCKSSCRGTAAPRIDYQALNGFLQRGIFAPRSFAARTFPACAVAGQSTATEPFHTRPIAIDSRMTWNIRS